MSPQEGDKSGNLRIGKTGLRSNPLVLRISGGQRPETDRMKLGEWIRAVVRLLVSQREFLTALPCLGSPHTGFFRVNGTQLCRLAGLCIQDAKTAAVGRTRGVDQMPTVCQPSGLNAVICSL